MSTCRDRSGGGKNACLYGTHCNYLVEESHMYLLQVKVEQKRMSRVLLTIIIFYRSMLLIHIRYFYQKGSDKKTGFFGRPFPNWLFHGYGFKRNYQETLGFHGSFRIWNGWCSPLPFIHIFLCKR